MNTLLEVHRRYAFLVEQAFKNESGFMQALDKAATTFINRNSITTKGAQVSISKSPEMLAKYCDQLLRKNNKAMDDVALEATLCDVVSIPFLWKDIPVSDDRLQVHRGQGHLLKILHQNVQQKVE